MASQWTDILSAAELDAQYVIPPRAVRVTCNGTYIRQFRVECDIARPAGAFNLTW